MTKHDYTAFDAELMRLIKLGFNTFTTIQTPKVLDMAKPFCRNSKSPYGDTPEWRIVDRRLQALRKAGKIRYIGGRWEAL